MPIRGVAFRNKLSQMQPGDSIFCRGEVDSQGYCGTACLRYGKIHGKVFTCFKQDGGVRIWRVE